MIASAHTVDVSLLSPATFVLAVIAVLWYVGKVVVAAGLAVRARRTGDRAVAHRAVQLAPPGSRSAVKGIAGAALIGLALVTPSVAQATDPTAPAPAPAPSGTSSAPILDRVPSFTTSPGPEPDTAASPEPDAAAGPAARHAVIPGENLWSIAEASLLGSGSSARPADVAALVDRIHSRNRAVIGADPNLIRPGQILVIPR